MELEVGMYIRYIPTQGKYTQKISKITKMENRILDMGYQLDNEKDLVFSCHFDQIIKASHNIIDLIEVGDYVNGAKVNFVYRPDGKQVFRIELDVVGLKGHMICENKDIKSIVTKEQFEAMAYKIMN